MPRFININLIQQLVYSSLFAALAFLSTSFLQIPITFGFIHLGDCLLFLILITFKKKIIVPFLAYAIFMGVSDIFLGYPNYALTTILSRIIIIVIYFSFQIHKFTAFFIWFIIPLNYFFTDLILFSTASAIFFLPLNLLQISIPLIMAFNLSFIKVLQLDKKISWLHLKNIHK